MEDVDAGSLERFGSSMLLTGRAGPSLGCARTGSVTNVVATVAARVILAAADRRSLPQDFKVTSRLT
jgi:hypothetical protein